MNTLKTIVLASMAAGSLTTIAFAVAANPDTQAAASMTRDQHLALAQQFDAKAAAANDKAAAHAVMARTATPKGSKLAMSNHCDKLVAQYRDEARDYAGEAESHRLAAK